MDKKVGIGRVVWVVKATGGLAGSDDEESDEDEDFADGREVSRTL